MKIYFILSSTRFNKLDFVTSNQGRNGMMYIELLIKYLKAHSAV